MARWQDDVAWFLRLPKPARLTLAAGAIAVVAFAYVYDLLPMLGVAAFFAVRRYARNRSKDTDHEARRLAERERRRAIRERNGGGLPLSGFAAPQALSPEPAKQAAEPLHEALNEARAARKALFPPAAAGQLTRARGASSPDRRTETPRETFSRPGTGQIVVDGKSLWRPRRGSAGGSIVE